MPAETGAVGGEQDVSRQQGRAIEREARGVRVVGGLHAAFSLALT